MIERMTTGQADTNLNLVNIEDVVIKSNRVGTKYLEVGGVVLAKECTSCGGIKEIGEFNKRSKGVQSRCRICTNNKKREASKGTLEKDRLRRREWYHRNKEISLNTSTKWKRNNPDKVSEYNRIYRIENREYFREYQVVNARQRNLGHQRRMARKLSLPDDLTYVQQESIMKYFGSSCALSGVGGKVHMDHVIPLSVGKGGTTLGNIVPLHPILNTSKYTANVFEWFKENQCRFKLTKTRFDRMIEHLASENKMSVSEYRDYVYSCYETTKENSTEYKRSLI